MRSDKLKLTRRQLIKGGLTSSTVLLLGFHLPGCSSAEEVTQAMLSDGTYMPNAWVMVDRDNQVTVMVNHSEMGQGVLTSLPTIIADEMDADWKKVKGEHAPVADVYKNPAMKMQLTGGSTSVRTTWDILRQAGATVRTLFVRAAAADWEVPETDCETADGSVIHRSSGQKLTYGELIDAAVKLPVPEKVQLKKPSQFNLIGKETARLDTLLKIDGSAIYGTDVNIPGMLNATVIHPPVIGSTLVSVDDSDALKMAGVKKVIPISTGIAVVADTYWQAYQASLHLKIEWTEGNKHIVDTYTLKKKWRELAYEKGDSVYELGNVEDIKDTQGMLVEADYELPFQAHATQEPMNCTADVRADGCDIWAPTQNQGGTHAIATFITGLDPDTVKVHTTFLGGGFGRRGEIDFVTEAVELSQAMKKPVKVIWSREEDMTTDFYRPASLNRMKAILDSDGNPLAWTHRIVGMDHFVQAVPKFIPALAPTWLPKFVKEGAASMAGGIMNTFAAGKGLTGGAGPICYDIENVRLEFVNDDIGVPVGFWRSVANSSNGFVVESFIDEMAIAADKDPFQYRFDLLKGQPRLQNVLKLAAEKSNWGSPAKNGASRGIAAHIFHDTLVSMVAEVTVSKEGVLTIHRVITAVDCGVVINPKIVKAQMESGIAFGLTATLKSKITFTEGRVDQQNFDSFEVLRLNEMPVVETYIVDSNEAPTGIGEVSVPTIGSVITNAIFAATGKRIRNIPFTSDDLAT